MWHMLDSYNPLMQGYIREVIRRERPDVASLHNLPGWSGAAWTTLYRARVPTIQVLHDYYPICVKANMYRKGSNCTKQCLSCRALRVPHRRLSRLVSGVVGVSAFVLEQHRRYGYFQDVAVQRVIHNARDAAQLNVHAIVAGRDHHGLRIGYIGRLDAAKGIELLIAAFQQARLADAELWIAGSGKSDYEQHLHGLIHDPHIRLLGRLAPAEFYPEVDVVAVPSLWNENLPTVVIEALIFGKPVIGALRGGIPEMIKEGENGWLVEPTDVRSMAELLRTLAANPKIITAYGAAAMLSAARYSNTKSWVRQYITLYEDVLHRPPMRESEAKEPLI
jgi:glycosyltransferase involved in cell wall biosynthesis